MATSKPSKAYLVAKAKKSQAVMKKKKAKQNKAMSKPVKNPRGGSAKTQEK